MSLFHPIDRLDLDALPLSPFRLEHRCLWCLSVAPADGVCRCPDSLRDLEQARKATHEDAA